MGVIEWVTRAEAERRYRAEIEAGEMLEPGEMLAFLMAAGDPVESFKTWCALRGLEIVEQVTAAEARERLSNYIGEVMRDSFDSQFDDADLSAILDERLERLGLAMTDDDALAEWCEANNMEVAG